MGANEAALQKHMDKIEHDEIAYDNMLEDLRDAEPEDYENIIDSHGWGDADLTEILGDI